MLSSNNNIFRLANNLNKNAALCYIFWTHLNRILRLGYSLNFTRQSRRIWRAVREATGWASTQIKALTDADCSPITMRRHLQEKGFKDHVSSRTTNLPIWTLQGRTKHGTLKGGWKFYSLTRKKLTWTVLMAFNITGMTKSSTGSGGGSIMVWVAIWRLIWVKRHLGTCLWWGGWVCQQDKAAARNAHLTKNFFQENNVAFLDHLACSPDINPN